MLIMTITQRKYTLSLRKLYVYDYTIESNVVVKKNKRISNIKRNFIIIFYLQRNI